MDHNEKISQIRRNIERQITDETLQAAVYRGARAYVQAKAGKRCDARDRRGLAAFVAMECGVSEDDLSVSYANPGRDTRLSVRFTSRKVTTWDSERAREVVTHESPQVTISLHAGSPGAAARFDLEWFDADNTHAISAPDRIAMLRATLDRVEYAASVMEAMLNQIQGTGRVLENMEEGGRHVVDVYNNALRHLINKLPGVSMR